MKRVFTLAVGLVLAGVSGVFAQSVLVQPAPTQIKNTRVANQPVVKIQTQRADTDSIDAMILSIDAASTLGCGIDSTPVAISFKNVGIDTIFTIDVSFIANNDTITETINDTIVQNDTVMHAFATMAGFNTNGTHSITTFVALAGDTFNMGDTAVFELFRISENDLTESIVQSFETDSSLVGWSADTIWNLQGDGGSGATPNTGLRHAVYLTGGNPVNAWFYSPCLKLDTGKLYKASFFTRAVSNTNERVALTLGNAPTDSTMETVLIDTTFKGLGYRKVEAFFEVDSNGTYYIGVNGKSDVGSSGAYVDDLVIEAIDVPDFEVILTGSDLEYGSIPYGFGPIKIGAKVENFGRNVLTNVQVEFVVSYAGGGELHSETVLIPSLDPRTTAIIKMVEGYETDEFLQGQHQISYTVSMDEPDFNENNNSLIQTFNVTDSIYGRDNGVVNGPSLSICNGCFGILGQLFTVPAPIELTGVEFVLIAPTVNDFLAADIYEFNGINPTRVVASTETGFVEQTGAQQFNLQLRNKSYLLDTGKTYYIGLNENSPGLTLATTTNYYTSNTAYIRLNNQWTTNSSEGFAVNFHLRATFGEPFDNTVGIEDAAYLNQFVSIFPNPAKEKMIIDFRLEKATDAKITITNVIGKTVYSQLHQNVMTESVNLDLTNQNPGVYLVTIEANGTHMTKKIVVTQ